MIKYIKRFYRYIKRLYREEADFGRSHLFITELPPAEMRRALWRRVQIALWPALLYAAFVLIVMIIVGIVRSAQG